MTMKSSDIRKHDLQEITLICNAQSMIAAQVQSSEDIRRAIFVYKQQATGGMWFNKNIKETYDLEVTTNRYDVNAVNWL